ncbi:MAG: dephospho-CoA kinase [Proteobacteria bacterium]|nr:dephospho-CoA kinase [Pseudomonadota bacterium]
MVGLTGGIGSGKSAVAARFRAHGIDVADADEIAHQLSAPGAAGTAAVVAAFGPDAEAPDGALARAWLRERAFADPSFRATLEGLLHPLIGRAIRDAAARFESPYGIVSAPLLLERGNLMHLVDRVLVVDAPEDAQVRRAVARGGVDAEAVRRIMATQLDRGARLARAHDVLDNSGPLHALDTAVAALHRRYLDLAAAGGNTNRPTEAGS